MSEPTIIVAGLGRCGTSMLMQMLHRGGVACVGEWPAFEVPEVRERVTPAFIEASRGKAVKVLDPHRVGLPGDVRVIWLDRDHRQQARSHAKFLETMTGMRYDRAGRRALAASLVRDTHAAMGVIGSRPVMRMRFEQVLADPRMAAVWLGEFTRAPGFDVGAAARAVRPRGPECAPDLAMEMMLMGAEHG